VAFISLFDRAGNVLAPPRARAQLGIDFTTTEIAWDGEALWSCSGLEIYRVQ
jgi:hypothetical protein